MKEMLYEAQEGIPTAEGKGQVETQASLKLYSEFWGKGTFLFGWMKIWGL